MNELALFAGAGGGILGGKLLGWRTVCAVEYDKYAASVLVARQNDGCLEPFPIWDDVRTFDGRPWRGRVDVVSGGFPCQDISAAGSGDGLRGEKSGLWGEMARIVREVRPRFVFVENSPILTSRGIDRVLGDLAEMGFDAEWGVMGADDVGANHIRKRIWIVAHSNRHGLRNKEQRQEGRRDDLQDGRLTISLNDGEKEPMANAKQKRLERQRDNSGQQEKPQPWNPGSEEPWYKRGGSPGWWETEPNVGRVAHGVASRVDRLKCLGNGQVPLVAAEAFRLLAKSLTERGA